MTLKIFLLFEGLKYPLYHGRSHRKITLKILQFLTSILQKQL